MPRNNHEWWLAKLDRNVARDREKDQLLRDSGWQVLHVWEHEDPQEAADTIEHLWRVLRNPPVLSRSSGTDPVRAV